MNPDETWPSAPGGDALSPPVSTRELCAFAREDAAEAASSRSVDYYVPRWVDALSSGAGSAGFNWAAALFAANWCFWRKLYALAFLILLAELVSSVLVLGILVQGFAWEPNPETLGSVVWLSIVPVRVLLGYHANGLYLGRAIQAVAEARRTYADAGSQQAFLAQRGGTSWFVLGIALGAQGMLMLAPSLGGA